MLDKDAVRLYNEASREIDLLKSTYFYLFLLFYPPDALHPVFFCYVNPQERKPQAQRDWLDLLQGRAHNVHKVDVCALSLCRRIRE